MGAFNKSSENTATQPEVPTVQVSLLGSRAQDGEALPSFDDVKGLDGSLAFLEAINAASPNTLERWVLELIKGDGAQKEYRRIQQLLGRYGALDPERALAFIAKHSLS